mmetsp:Transcript_11867/g.40458  ORF Transcript_11867/g.40458 Transcript_11867/m.40458 type:complete len:245 (+) Transcript_11867:77-811(+)
MPRAPPPSPSTGGRPGPVLLVTGPGPAQSMAAQCSRHGESVPPLEAKAGRRASAFIPSRGGATTKVSLGHCPAPHRIQRATPAGASRSAMGTAATPVGGAAGIQGPASLSTRPPSRPPTHASSTSPSSSLAAEDTAPSPPASMSFGPPPPSATLARSSAMVRPRPPAWSWARMRARASSARSTTAVPGASALPGRPLPPGAPARSRMPPARCQRARRSSRIAGEAARPSSQPRTAQAGERVAVR